ncbi:MAG: helix-turn-helix domain-containing protein [Candidatus Eisenbacteria bacterium]
MPKTRKVRPRKPRTVSTSAPNGVPPRPVRNVAIVDTEELGLRMRKTRMERRMTLKQVERAANLSATHLSEIERGRTSPTIGALVRIARALGRDTSYFIEREERNEVVHVARDQAARLQLSPGVEATVMTRGIPGSRLFVYRLTLTPGAGKQGEFLLAATDSHEGEAIYYVRSGEALSRFGDDEVELHPGDGVQAGLGLTHVLRPAAHKPVELFALLTRPIDGGL